MNEEKALLANIDKVHTTEMGRDRIRKNLNLNEEDVVAWCKEQISTMNCRITRKGKNWYAETETCIIAVNAHSYTIITAHKIKKGNQ